VKVNLDPATAEAAIPALVGDVAEKPRSTIYYRIHPTPSTDHTIVRARRDSKNKTDLDVKLRDIGNLAASALTDEAAKLDELECEWDMPLAGEGKLSCDIKTETKDDTSPLDGASVKSRLDEQQRKLLVLGTRRPFNILSLTACPTVSTRIWKDIPEIAGCTDGATLEVWMLDDGPLYELSCKTTTLEEARAGLQATIDAVGVAAAADQRGKTERALEQCD
jgi:hypothetical protein